MLKRVYRCSTQKVTKGGGTKSDPTKGDSSTLPPRALFFRARELAGGASLQGRSAIRVGMSMHLNQISWPAECDVDELVAAAGGNAGGDGKVSEKVKPAEEEVCACVLCAETLRVRMCHIPPFSPFC